MNNPEISPDDPRIPSRPLWGLVILTLPILGTVIVFVAYSVMWSMGLAGRSAAGEPVELRFQGCPEAAPIVEARLADMGLPSTRESTPDGFVVRAALTGDPEVDARIPDTLAMPGVLEVRSQQGEQLVTSSDLVDATVRLDLYMAPFLLLKLDDAAAERIRDHVRENPRGRMTFFVDGAAIGEQANTNPVQVGELEVEPTIADDQERMRAVAAWSVTLDHGPLPCSVRPVSDAQ